MFLFKQLELECGGFYQFHFYLFSKSNLGLSEFSHSRNQKKKWVKCLKSNKNPMQ